MSLISPFEIVDHYAMHCWGRAECLDPDSRNAVVAGSKGLAGLGAWYEYIPLWPSDRESDPCAPAPIWCTYTPGAQYLTECQIMTEAQQIACQRGDFGPAMTDANREKAVQAGQQSVDAYKRILAQEDPDKLRAFEDEEKRAKCVASGQSAFMCDYGTYLMWGSVAAVAFLMISRR